jgi:glycosyltransferase involved in cell wall biosynthesis
MKVLVVTPRSPFQGKGADEQDRLSGIRRFVAQGWEVEVVTKTLESDIECIEKAKKNMGINIIGIPYKSRRDWPTLLKRVLNPHYWDGAAYEYFDEEIQRAVKSSINSFNPDVVWFDYTYLWPLYKLAKKAHKPIITRSINFEPTHFLDEDGWNPINILRSIPKFYSELRACWESDLVFSITPKERKIYQKLGARVVNLPLRGLPAKVSGLPKLIVSGPELHLGFAASTYNVAHNLKALMFLIKEVLPKLGIKYKLSFTGGKLPTRVEEDLPPNTCYLGFVPSIEDFWKSVDIAAMPSLFGSGMQQKIFEPLTMGVPTVASPRAIADYPFKDKIHYRAAVKSGEFATAIEELGSDIVERRRLSEESRTLALELFSQRQIDEIVGDGIKLVLHEKNN